MYLVWGYLVHDCNGNITTDGSEDMPPVSIQHEVQKSAMRAEQADLPSVELK